MSIIQVNDGVINKPMVLYVFKGFLKLPYEYKYINEDFRHLCIIKSILCHFEGENP